MGGVIELEVRGVRPRESPRKKWKNSVEEDLREMNLRETYAMDRDDWRAAIIFSNPVTLKKTLKEKVSKVTHNNIFESVRWKM